MLFRKAVRMTAEKLQRMKERKAQKEVEDALVQEFHKALDDYHLALAQFDNATEDFVEISVLKLKTAKDKLNNTICSIKLNRGEPIHSTKF